MHKSDGKSITSLISPNIIDEMALYRFFTGTAVSAKTQKHKNTTFFWNRLYLVKNRTRLVLPCQKNVTSLVRFFTRYSRFQKNVLFLSFCWNGCTSKKSIQSHFIYYNWIEVHNVPIILDHKLESYLPFTCSFFLQCYQDKNILILSFWFEDQQYFWECIKIWTQ